MKLGEEKMTSPRAMGSKKAPVGSWGAVGSVKKVSTVNVKGGQEKYSGQKSDMKLPQHGGEGGGKEGKVAQKTDDTLLLHSPSESYGGPGRTLTH